MIGTENPSDPRAKVASGKHCVYTHFPKDPNCDICLKTKITRASCRRRTVTVVPRAGNFGDLITADHKVLCEGCESRHNHLYAVVVQDLAAQRIQSYPCKSKNFTRNPEKLAKVPGTRRGSHKSFTLTIPQNLANLVKKYPGITVRQYHTDQKQMGLLRGQCIELRKAPLRYCCNQLWMKNSGRIPWSATAICEILRICYLMGSSP